MKNLTDHKQFLGPTICSNLDHIRNDVVNKNYDFLGVASGYEGNGKTNLAAAIGFYLSPHSFSNKFVALTEEQVDKLIRTVGPADFAQIDEGTEVLHSKEGMTRRVRNREKRITQMRGKNCFVMVCISDLKMLDRYIRTSRAIALFWLNRRGQVWVYDLRRTDIKKIIKGIEERKPERPAFIDWVKPLCPISFKQRCDTCTKKKCYSKFWKKYSLRKYKFMSETDKKTETQRRLEAKIRKQLSGSLTIQQIADSYQVSYQTSWKYIKLFVPKRCIFKDFSDVLHVNKRGLYLLQKRWLAHKKKRKSRRK